MSKSEMVQKLLRRYDYLREIPEPIREQILKAKKRTYAFIMQTEARPGMAFALSGKIRSLLAYLGVGVSMKASRKIAFAGVAIALLAVPATIGVQRYLQPEPTAPVANPIIPEPKQSLKVLFAVGSVDIIAGDVSTPASVGTRIEEGAVIRTGEKSFVVVDLMGSGSVRINANTEYSFGVIKPGTEISGRVAKGSIYSTIKKMAKDEKYEVNTLNFTAAVRGTGFLVAAPDAGDGVRVREGKVRVNTGAAAYDVESGKGIGHTEGALKPYTLTRPQKKELESYAAYTEVENADSMTDEELIRVYQEIMEKEAASAPTANNLSPLDKLRKEGKPLTMLHLRDGSQIAGYVVSSGSGNLRLNTGDGVISIPVAEILRRTPMK
jgi:hypothetical protein